MSFDTDSQRMTHLPQQPFANFLRCPHLRLFLLEQQNGIKLSNRNILKYSQYIIPYPTLVEKTYIHDRV